MFLSFQRFAGLLCFFFFFFFFFFYFCFFFPTSILPHTFEPLCGIVPWSWLGSLLPRPRLPPGQLAHAPQIGCCQPGHGSEARSPESSEARGACPPSMREPESLLSQFRTGRVGGWGWHMFSQQRASKWMWIGVYVRSGEVSSPPPQHRVNCVLVSQRAGFLSPVAVAQR